MVQFKSNIFQSLIIKIYINNLIGIDEKTSLPMLKFNKNKYHFPNSRQINKPIININNGKNYFIFIYLFYKIKLYN